MAEDTNSPQQAPDPTASIADPAPLGLAAFALTTFVLSVFNAGLLSSDLEPVVLPLALFYGGLAQFMAGMWEFRKANTFGALAFTSYGAFWLSFAAYVQFVTDGLGPDAATATGLYLLAWGIFTAYMTVAAMRVTVAVLSVFVALTLTFFLLAIGDLSGVGAIATLGGWVGLITAVLAWYASFAGVANFTWKRTLLPVGSLAPKS
ncbi:hypothetical protein FHX42_002054 [Saccharopolyspora lacisalsi]|uniref:Uncharacterized protein n=1 Tax=Halosaccharopolyspora lacisalsi TaxID=1000566 RepID=A0A839DYZ1_9PSEU|nr:acetate uptake transporter [Halosaccharopolyspora lacisalsi]MBA8824707.1 hypothetical protein [Halosaccharopolyspora lacisalsi]